MEADIAKRTKLEAVSTMAGGIAHDWNNILTIILGNLDLALSHCRPQDAITPMLRSANVAALEARELTFKFLCFARRAVQERTTIHAGSLAEETCRTTLSGKPVSGQVIFENGLRSLKGDPQLLRTVLVNVLDNARAASPVGGRIFVRIKNIDVKPDDALSGQLRPGPYLRLEIQDEGCGIPPDIQDRVFDPYFSTKQRGTQKGMGMGLAVAWGIVQSHGGHIAVTSREGAGTTVTIHLPAVPEARSLAAGLAEMEGPLRAKILVMDDEPMLRQLAEAVMEHLGYQCDTARHGKEAIAMYKQAMEAGEPYDLVILDLTVKGGMGGIPTMAQLLNVDPKVKAVIYTGYSADPIFGNLPTLRLSRGLAQTLRHQRYGRSHSTSGGEKGTLSGVFVGAVNGSDALRDRLSRRAMLLWSRTQNDAGKPSLNDLTENAEREGTILPNNKHGAGAHLRVPIA
ncbi:ATP-binding protein [Desulfosoma sp.]|uniref:ATP-binding protein n=1 Tax=Desulfosoma sp. TaxID=2603217 RepID=UPI0040490C15